MDGSWPSGYEELTRRRFVGGAAGVAAAAVVTRVPNALAKPRHRRRPRRQRVAVLGGGVAGLTAAHELAERGFAVTVYERRAFGGKARSMGVPRSAAGGRAPLPGEHGMRFFPGYYANLPDTLRRIPFAGNPNGVFDNLESANQVCFARDGGRSDLLLPFTLDSTGWSPAAVGDAIAGMLSFAKGASPPEIAYFVSRLQVFFSSCDARRLGQWEKQSWWDFVAAERFSTDYQRVIVNSISRQILAVRARMACARTLGIFWEAFVYNLLGRSGNGPFDRVLDAPTNEAWIDPWCHELRRLGVRFRPGSTVSELHMRHGHLAGAVIKTRRGRHRVHADWFVLAVPVERARRLWNRDLLRAEPRLRAARGLKTRWMNAIQFYLREQTPVIHGHVLYVDSPWALTSLSQSQFWPGGRFADRYGDGSVAECVSVDIGDFDEPGILYGKTARELSPRQIADEVWAQMEAALNDTGRTVLRDDALVRWHLDPGLVFRRRGGIKTSEDPMMISTPGSWDRRPETATAIPNLFLAADWVKVPIDFACMEGANTAARSAVNHILEASGSHESHAAVHGMYLPPEYEGLRRADESRFRAGQPNIFDMPPP